MQWVPSTIPHHNTALHGDKPQSSRPQEHRYMNNAPGILECCLQRTLPSTCASCKVMHHSQDVNLVKCISIKKCNHIVHF